MATLVLGLAGQAIGASIGGGLLGISAATIGGAIGTMAGSVVDSWIVGSLQPDQRYEGARLDSLRVTSATEGTTIPRLFGRMRLGGNIIWATDFTEHVSTTTQGGGKGGGPTVTTTEYSYTASFAVVLCEGPITGIGRIWADGELLDTSTATWRWYPGDEVQAADPFIAAKMGAEGAPAYRGTAYVVFEELDLTSFGNRIPQLSFEVFRPLADPDTAEGAIRAVTMIPGAGEFVYATEPVMRVEGAKTKPENVHAETDRADFPVSLDRLEALAPGVESVSLVVSWFGSDLRAGHCAIRPGVETATKTTTPQVWQVNGAERASAHLVSTDAEGRPIYGGTPSDAAVVQAIKALKARGYRVTFYPFLLMDVPEGNSLPNPYSDNAATGAWAGWDGDVALFSGGAWLRLSPQTGWRAWVEDEAVLLVFGGAAWIGVTPNALQNLTRLGLGTTADAVNPFSAKLNGALWTAKTVAEGGTGDLLYTMNKEAAGDDLGLTLQTGFVTKALMGLFGSDRFRLAVSADGSIFFDVLSVDNTTGIVDQPRLPRFKAHTNYDNYVGVGTWTKIGINNTDYNDQGAFDATNNHFVAPVDGTYLFGTTLLYKVNASTSARMRGRLVLNGATEIRGSFGEVSSSHKSLATALWLQTMVPLSAGDTVELQGYFRAADGFFAADHTSFWGAKVG